MYKSQFREDKSDVTVAPKGTVFVKVGSHRARDYFKRYDIDYIGLHSFDYSIDLNLIKEEDYPKVEKVKGISKPVTKVKGKYSPRWSSKEDSPGRDQLVDLFRKANPR